MPRKPDSRELLIPNRSEVKREFDPSNKHELFSKIFTLRELSDRIIYKLSRMASEQNDQTDFRKAIIEELSPHMADWFQLTLEVGNIDEREYFDFAMGILEE